METLCHCGKSLHYKDKQMQALVQKWVDKLGEFVIVRDAQNRGWLIQRHYIALHGLRSQQLSELGFEQLKE